MARFDVYANVNAHSRRLYPFLIEIQADLLSGLPTTVVIPLATPSAVDNRPASKLNPQFTISGKRLLAMTQELSAIQRKSLGKRVDSLATENAKIIAALDLLLSGY